MVCPALASHERGLTPGPTCGHIGRMDDAKQALWAARYLEQALEWIEQAREATNDQAVLDALPTPGSPWWKRAEALCQDIAARHK